MSHLPFAHQVRVICDSSIILQMVSVLLKDIYAPLKGSIPLIKLLRNGCLKNLTLYLLIFLLVFEMQLQHFLVAPHVPQYSYCDQTKAIWNMRPS